ARAGPAAARRSGSRTRAQPHGGEERDVGRGTAGPGRGGGARAGLDTERRARPGAAVLDEFLEVTGRRLAELTGFSEERFEQVGPSPIGQVPYREFMWTRAFDSWVHEQDMRRAIGRT